MSKYSCTITKKSFISVTALILSVALLLLPITSYADGNCPVSKCSASVKDSTVTTYSTYYLSFIPAQLQDIYAADGGNIRVFYETDPLPEIDTSGWTNTGNIIGYFEWSSGPLIMLSTKPVERASACVTDQVRYPYAMNLAIISPLSPISLEVSLLITGFLLILKQPLMQRRTIIPFLPANFLQASRKT